jgi:hypothetical protein
VAKEPIDLAARGARGGNLLLAGDRLLIAGSRNLQVFPLEDNETTTQVNNNPRPAANSQE